MNNIMRNVLMRRSTRQFDLRPLREDDLMAIVEEGRLLSNASSNQEWHFTVLENRGLLCRLGEVCDRLSGEGLEGTVVPQGRLLAEAPAMLIVAGRGAQSDIKLDAANMLFGSMMLVADKYGIGSCWLSSGTALFEEADGAKVLAELGIPEGFVPLCVGVFGYRRNISAPRVMASADNIVNIVK